MQLTMQSELIMVLALIYVMIVYPLELIIWRRWLVLGPAAIDNVTHHRFIWRWWWWPSMSSVAYHVVAVVVAVANGEARRRINYEIIRAKLHGPK